MFLSYVNSKIVNILIFIDYKLSFLIFIKVFFYRNNQAFGHKIINMTVASVKNG